MKKSHQKQLKFNNTLHKSKIFKIFLLLVSFQFHLLESADPMILLTLQYHNSRMVSKRWALHDFNAISIFKTLLDDLPNESRQRLIFPLQQEHNHITHTSLANLITGNVAPHGLEQYLKDYHYFIGDTDLDLGDNKYKTVKQKVLKEHYNDFARNLDNNFFKDFAWLDLDSFLQKKLEIDFVTAGMPGLCINHDSIPFNHEQIIELVEPAITIQMNHRKFFNGGMQSCSVTVQSNRYIEINNPTLFKLIQFIAWKAHIALFENLRKEELGEKFSHHFAKHRTLFKEISLKNFFFKGLHLDPIIQNTNTISFENSDITISDNDINMLQKLQKENITNPAPSLFNFYDSYFGIIYEKYSLEIDFGNAHIKNPDKFLDLIDVYNGYFQTILIKNVPINKTKLWFKQLLCRKLARAKFCMSLIVNTIILVKMFKTYGWFWKTGKYWGIFFFATFGTIFSLASYCIQDYIYYRMIDYPENQAKGFSKKSFNTNGGVTFKSNHSTQTT